MHNKNLPIFEPFPVNSISPNQLCNNASTDIMSVFQSNQKKLIALNLKSCGFGIYDITSLENDIFLLKHFEYQPEKQNVQYLGTTDYQKYLWVAYETGLLEIYDISDQQFPLKVNIQITYQGQLDVVHKVTQFDGFSFIFLSCLNNFKTAVWLNDKIIITSEIHLNDLNISKIILQPQQNMLFIQGQSSIHFFKQTINEIQQGIFHYLCSYQPYPNNILSSFEVMKQFILIIQIQFQEYLMVDIQNYIESYDGTKPNLNLDIPNLLMNQFYLNRNGVISLQSYFENKLICYLERIPGTTIFYLLQKQQGIQILDLKNVSNPQILNPSLTLGYSSVQFKYIAFNSLATFGFISNLSNLIIINILNRENPSVLSIINTSFYLNGDSSLEQFTLSNDESLLFLFPKQYGILIASISDILNPSIVFKLAQKNINALVQTLDNYLICSIEFQGILVYFLNSNFQLTFISDILIQGVINTAQLIYSDNYLLVATAERNQIYLINLKNKTNPSIIQNIELLDNDIACSIATYSDEQFAFVSTYSNIYQLFLQSPFIFHQQIYKIIQIPNSNQYKRINTFDNQPLQVGDQVDIYLININNKNELKISQAFYYQNFIAKKLPDWMKFQFSNQVLSMKISKDSLFKDASGSYSLNSLQQVIFLGYQQLQDDAFINQNLSIDYNDSLFLKQICTKLGYLDKYGFVSPSYSPKNMFTLREYQYTRYFSKWSQTQIKLQQLLNFVQFTLNQNIVNYVVQFETQPSLIVDFDNPQNPIQSNQNLITLTLQTSIGQFVSKNYSGVIEIINSQGDTIKLQGSVLSLNQALKQKIKLFLQDIQLLNQAYITVTIDDSINYEYFKIFPLNQVNFISLEAPISLYRNIQDDLNQYYDNGEIYVLTPFNYQINDRVFKYDKEQNIIFTAQIQKADGQFEDIPANFWLQFSTRDLSFKGTPSTQIFNTEYVILVQATDGYSIIQVKFKIKIIKVPFFLVIQIILQIIGPIIGLKSIWKRRMKIFNIFFAKQTKYTQELAYVSEYYEKTFMITDNLLYLSQKLWKNVNIQNYKQQIIEQINGVFQNVYFRNQILQNYEFIFQLDVNNKPLSEEISNQINPIMINKNQEEIESQNNQLNSVLLTQNYTIDQKQMRDSSQILPTQQSILVNNDTNIQINKINYNITEQPKKDQEKKKQDKLQFKNILKLKNLIDLEKNLSYSNTQNKNLNKKDIKILKENGLIDINGVIGLIIQSELKLPMKKRVLTKQLMEKLLTGQSLFQRMVQGLLIEFLIECIPVCQQILLLLKMESTKFYSEKDWYKAYIIFGQYQQNQDQFPTCKLNEESIKLAFQQFASEMETYQKNLIDKQSINQTSQNILTTVNSFNLIQYLECLVSYMPLIEQYLYTQLLGVSIKKQKIYEISKGECFHCNSFKIRSIKSYETRKGCSCCTHAEKFLNLNDVEKGLSDYQKLPEWIKIDFQKQSMKIKGIPKEENIGQQRIKIYDYNGYLLRQFDIQVLPERKEKQNQLEEIKTENQQNSKILSPLRKKRFNNKGFLLSQSLFKNNLFKKQKSLRETIQFDDNIPNKIQSQEFKSNSRNNQNITSIKCFTLQQ
ncbi:hypothetical protein TTHERM_00129880 (macronuclear) [Tetrahymena thermophila SB210]|uniref:Dystroglycan-type cadherin-like domain-containing protein n=1 Tax=Tetrahymena thermophila (strain SB210) TaxID=312017 RepID=I7M1F2_TETTS|nr:hypothetical protein TTHERM_00129880 [Tetrahymena thermophila SB210]EAR96211.2 hypothetical protein TTHERM_00129880 [Tetrahymena thermophila SB210]|eukprot:XP_001016456.2 hypothetical protein TTHERM_00129880 [Tetrahymena thermophila SB210]